MYSFAYELRSTNPIVYDNKLLLLLLLMMIVTLTTTIVIIIIIIIIKPGEENGITFDPQLVHVTISSSTSRLRSVADQSLCVHRPRTPVSLDLNAKSDVRP